MRIILTGATSLSNKGTSAIIISTINYLKKEFPGSKILVELFYPEKQRLIMPIEGDDVKIIPPLLQSPLKSIFLFLTALLSFIFRVNKFKIPVSFFTKNFIRYLDADLIIDISAEAFVKYYDDDFIQMVARFLLHLYPILIAIFLEKPFILLAQSLAPFGIFKPLLTYVIKKSNLITVRDAVSIQNLKREGVYNKYKPKIFLTADPAFLLEPAPIHRIKKILEEESIYLERIKNRGKKIIGISAAKVTGRTLKVDEYEALIKIFSEVSDNLIKNNNFEVFFIPHSSGKVREKSDDVKVGLDIAKHVKDKGRFHVIGGDYTPQELKGIIGQCNAILSLRMHPVISAISLNVPSVIIAFNDKAYGLMQRFGLEDYLCDIKNLESSVLTEKVVKAVSEQKNIFKSKKQSINEVNKSALSNFRILSELVKGLKSHKLEDIEVCYGCGTCVSICPNNAIKMKLTKTGTYLPEVDKQKCTNCDLCIKVCPWLLLNKEEINNFVHKNGSRDILLGNVINCYLGYSLDEKIREKATSGGLVTSLLIYALEKKKIDGVLLTRMSRESPLEPEPFIAKTKEEIISAMGSKYLPIPVNVGLKEILKEEGKFAVVGLPCHFHGIRKAELMNKQLKRKIVLHLGLVCSGTISLLGTQFLLNCLNINLKDVSNLLYRASGWPGGFIVELKNGKKTDPIPYDHYFSLIRAFVPLQCLVCWDHTNEFSDISFGDAWLKDIRNKDKKGTSIIISRTEIGEQLLREVKREKIVKLSDINCLEVIKAQRDINFKKQGLNIKLKLFKIFSNNIPAFKKIEQKRSVKISAFFRILFTFLRYWILSKDYNRKILIPFLKKILISKKK